MVNLLTTPQRRENPVLPEEPPRHSSSLHLLSKIYCWFSWMAGFLIIKNKCWMAGRDQQKHVFRKNNSPNIISNSDFSVKTLEHWHCLADAKGYVIPDKSPYPISERETYALIKIQNKGQGLQQEINVSPDITYKLVARVGVLGIHPDHTLEVQATLLLETEGSSDQECRGVARVDATSHDWTNLKGSFKLKAMYHRVFLCLSVPDPSVNLNLIVAHVDIRPS